MDTSSKLKVSPGSRPTAEMLIDVAALESAYYTNVPDPAVPAQRVAFGTSGHRGCSLERSFNEFHMLAMTQAVCDYRQLHGSSGPLFLGIDTHALSVPACASTLEVLAANGVDVMLATNDEYTPTPAVSHAIIAHNRGRSSGFADGIVITPSHNPPAHGGYKYNTPKGGPADTEVTRWIEASANAYLENNLGGVKRMAHDKALLAPTTHRYDYLNTYVNELANVIDMDVIRGAAVRMGVDPLGGAGVHYWSAIAARYSLDLTVVNTVVDPTFRFMTVDWDGQIRMDPSSPFAMRNLVGLKDRFDVAFACDTDHDRHGIVCRSAGLLPSNHYLAVCIDYLFQNRPEWSAQAAIGKTIVSTGMIDRVAAKLARKVYEVPVGFKWYVDGLYDGALAFAGEESAGATFARRDGTVWTTDKDGITAALLAAEMTARTGRDPGEIYAGLERELGVSYADRVDAPATPSQKRMLSQLSPQQVHSEALAGEKITGILSHAPGNQAPIGGLKVMTENGWFAARPSGTENIYKIYAESFLSEQHLREIITQAQQIVDVAIDNPGGK